MIYTPIHKIEVSEYECIHCGYKWINRINGKDGPLPVRCAKCKRQYWNQGHNGEDYNPIGPKERSLRVRLYKFEGYDPRKYIGLGGSTSYRPNSFLRKFLEMKPRPTMHELIQVLQPLGWDIHRYKGYVNDPERQGYLKYDPRGYEKLLEQETQKRRELMTQIMKSRGIDAMYSAADIRKEVEDNSKGQQEFLQKLENGTLFGNNSL